MEKAVVVGAGAMGHGIAQLLAMAGFETWLVDVKEEILDKALNQVRWSLGKLVEKGRVREEEAKKVLERLKTTVNLEDAVRDARVVVEAVPENLELKKQVFGRLGKATQPNTLLATNTSSLSITEISKAVEKPERVVGMHFFNPPVLMPLVEVVKGEYTSDEVAGFAMDLARRMGKTPILVRKDVRGFIVNRILISMFTEVCLAVCRGEATIEVVDAAVKYKAGLPMGAFELADYIGLDVAYNISKVMEEAYGERAKVCPELEKLVKEGKLGQKTGKGFYDWSVGYPRIPFKLADKYDVWRIYVVSVNEASWLLKEDVATPQDIDTAIKLGTSWVQGPCELGDELGLDLVLSRLRELHMKYKEEIYKPCPLLEEYVGRGWLGRKTKRGFYIYE